MIKIFQTLYKTSLSRNWIILLGIFIWSLAYRLNGLFNNHPLWVDEFSTAHQAFLLTKHGIFAFFDQAIFFEVYKVSSTLLGLLGLTLFGHEEWALRFFFVIVGALVPVLVYLVGRKISTHATALSAAIFSTTSYFLITWSRQARSYSLQLALTIGLFYVFFRLQDIPLLQRHKSRKLLDVYFALVVVSIFTHPMLYIVLCTHFLMLLFEIAKELKNKAKGKWRSITSRNMSIVVTLGVLICVGLAIGISYLAKIGSLNLSNNLWLYHSFLWREYGLVTFLGGVGLLLLCVRTPKRGVPIALFCIFHMIFITFIFPAPTTRYTLPLFPWLFLGMGTTLYAVSQILSMHLKNLSKEMSTKNALYTFISTISNAPTLTGVCTILLTGAIIIQGYKFDIKPNAFYSVNHDFREIALIDYDQIYDIVREKGALEQKQTAVIDTWADRAAWYVGNEYPAMYNFRWADAGLMKKTGYEYNDEDEKVLWKRNSIRFITEVDDLKKAVKRFPKGFMLIDDASMPQDVIMYAKTHFKEELSLRRYDLDDNPFSDWPVTLYSWGVK